MAGTSMAPAKPLAGTTRLAKKSPAPASRHVLASGFMRNAKHHPLPYHRYFHSAREAASGVSEGLRAPRKGSEIHHFSLDSARTWGMLTVQRMSVTGSYFPVAEGVSCLGASRGPRS